MRYLYLLTLLFLLFACKKKSVEKTVYDFPQIMQKDTLVAATLYGSSSYFIYKGEEMGFDYELCSRFANDNGLVLKIKLAQSKPELFKLLDKGEVDMIACGVSISNELKQQYVFGGNFSESNQVLVQRSSRKEVSSVVELLGKEVYVIQGTKYEQRLRNLNDELGGGIIIKTTDDSVSVDDLMEKVAMGDIDYTIADKDVALLNKTYFRNLDVKLTVSFPQRSAWAMRKNSPLLVDAVNGWFKSNVEQTHYRFLYNKYFIKAKYFGDRKIKIPKGAISPYDNLFKQYSSQIKWDWPLLAAMCFEESGFDTTVVSWVGAQGLMQLMPRTAEQFGVDADNIENPQANIAASVKYLRFLDKMFALVEKEERIKFILAAYNAGPSHVLDAMALAEKYGKSKRVWYGNVEYCLQLKSNKEYYDDPVVKSGYFRAGQTIRYVNDVLQTYERYKSRR